MVDIWVYRTLFFSVSFLFCLHVIVINSGKTFVSDDDLGKLIFEDEKRLAINNIPIARMSSGAPQRR